MSKEESVKEFITRSIPIPKVQAIGIVKKKVKEKDTKNVFKEENE